MVDMGNIFLIIFYMVCLLHMSFAQDVKSLSRNTQDATYVESDLRASLYTVWHRAISLYGTPLHIDSKSFPYANIHAKKGGVLKQHSLGGFDSLDNFVLKGAKADGLELVYDKLMEQSLDEPFSIYPLVADKISIAVDGSGVRFHINKDARFSDGVGITSSDVKFSFEVLMQRGSPNFSRYYKDVGEVKIISDRVVEFIFTNSENKELPLIIASLNILPKHFYVRDGVNSFGDNPLTLPLGSGPYRVGKYEINKRIEYIKNDNYWAKDLMVNRGLYNFNKIVFDYYKDDSVALRAFLSGAYDYRIEAVAKNWATGYQSRSLNNKKFRMIEIKHSLPVGMQGFYINTRKDYLKDIRVREALNLAFDFEWSNKNLFFSQYTRTKSYYQNSIFESSGVLDKDSLEGKILTKLNQLNCLESKNNNMSKAFFTHNSHESYLENPTIQKDIQGSLNKVNKISGTNSLDSNSCIHTQLSNNIFIKEYTNPNTLTTTKRQNLLKAQNLLGDAGFRIINNTTLVDAHGLPLRLELLLNSNIFERVILPFKKNLASLGITLDVRVLPQAQYENLVKKFNYDLIIGLVPQSLSPGNEQGYFFSSKSSNIQGSYNFSGIEDENIDYLINLLNKTENESKRVAILRAMDRILLWGYYVVPHYYSQNFRLALYSHIKMPKIHPKYGINPYLWWIDQQ